tara:strand:+ start:38 stop:865 length:828 start_codon:yes stop_codon:yes gene_type:complete
MDHKVSKDMISSGMTPSGEKTQADLGRTQYGSAPSPSKLMDAYKSMYEHHKKDADGNTIPHEGEELNEEPITAALIGGAKLLGGKALAGAAGKGLTAGASKLATRAAIKVGGKSAGKMVKGGLDAFGKMDNLQKFQTYQMGKDALNTAKGAVNALKPQGVQKNKGTNTISADADLFDIVKGQLLDEGLSEEEITDIMLTLTPDEIMSEMAVNPNIAAMDAKNKADMVARAKTKEVPQDVKDASKRQYTAGGPKDKGENKYTTQDKKTIIDYNKNK